MKQLHLKFITINHKTCWRCTCIAYSK